MQVNTRHMTQILVNWIKYNYFMLNKLKGKLPIY